MPVYANPSNVPRCLVHLLDLYLSKLPSYAFQKEIFTCVQNLVLPQIQKFHGMIVHQLVKKSYEPWFETCVKLLAYARRPTIHSELLGQLACFSSNVPERMIQSYTGHRSLEALRKYERPSQNQYQKVSEILTAQDKRVFGQEITNLQTT